MKAVITGGAGFIGSHLVEELSRDGFEIHVVDNLRTGFLKNLENLKYAQFHKVSITERDKIFEIVEDVDYIFNFAALVSVPESVMNPRETVEINVKGLLNILDAAKENNVKKVIHISSAAVYGDDPELPKVTSMRPNPKSPYAITKLDGEYYCNFYKNEFGLNTTSLRFFNVFGPRQDPKSQYAAAIPIFIEKAIKNEEITIFGDGEQTRDFIFVKDVVNACIKASKKTDVSGVFNVALGRSISINEIAKKIIEITESKSKIVYKPERAGDIKHSLASVDQTKDLLDFNPSYDLNKGLEETIKYFKEIIG